MMLMPNAGLGGNALRPDPYYGSVVLLLHCDGADGSNTFTDTKGHAMTVVGNARVESAQYRFGGASALFDGSGDRITTPDSNDWNLGSGDFTLEVWIRANSLSANGSIMSQWATGGGSNNAWSLLVTSDGAVSFAAETGGGSVVTGAGVIATGVWQFLSVTRSGNTLYVHVDGVMRQSASYSSTINNSTLALVVGDRSTADVPFNGWIDEVRITKGVARYGAGNYGLPVSPFSAY